MKLVDNGLKPIVWKPIVSKLLFTLIFFFSTVYIGYAQHIQLPRGEVGEKIEIAWNYYHDDDFAGAMDLLFSVLKDHPKNPLVEHMLGYFYMEDQNWDEAAKYLQDSLSHTSDEQVNLWNHLYLAEIFKEKGFPEKSVGHIDFVKAHKLTPNMIKRVAKIRMDLRIMEILDSTAHAGNITIRYPHFLLPEEKIDEIGVQLNDDWSRICAFLDLAGDEKFEVFVYPSQRLLDSFFPFELQIREEDYSFDQIHTVHHGKGDYMSVLAPYAYYLLSHKFNRFGAPYWMIHGLDDAIRGSYQDVQLHSWVSELYNQDKLPSLMFLLDPDYAQDMPSGIRDPSAGSFILFLKNNFHPNDFLYILSQPNLEFNFEKNLEEIEALWIRHTRSQRSLLENKNQAVDLVGEVEKFITPPVIGKDLMDELKQAAALNDTGKTDDALDMLETILRIEPRYGDALYLKGKILYDKSKLMDAYDVLIEAVKYIPGHQLSSGWAYYFLGRISKLKESFDEAAYFYNLAVRSPLPEELLEESHTNIYILEKYLAIRPHLSAVVTDSDIADFKSALEYLDDVLLVRDWVQFQQLTAYNLNPQAIDNLQAWYLSPVRFKDNVVYSHELVKSEVGPESAKLQVILSVSYPEIDESDESDDSDGFEPVDNLLEPVEVVEIVKPKAKPSKEYTRFFLLTRVRDGWLILDYFDQKDLYW